MKSDSKVLWRLFDANFNRAKEALRVAEDLCRFVLDDAALSRRFKSLRHELSTVLLGFPVPYVKLLASRDSVQDVGKKSVIRDKARVKWQDLMIANLKRAQEAMRVLEEGSKIVSENSSRKFQKIRFECYELEKQSIRKF